jgi:hypothetical protein
MVIYYSWYGLGILPAHPVRPCVGFTCPWWLLPALAAAQSFYLFLYLFCTPSIMCFDDCPQAWSRLWLSHVYYWWLSSGLITTMIESCLLLMIVFRPDHDYDWVMFIFDDFPQAWSRLWLSQVYFWWLSSGLITTMIESCLLLMIVLRPDHDYDWVMFIIDDCPQAWSRLWLSHVYYWWLSSGLITTMIESCLLLMIAHRPDHDYDWVMFIIDDCPQAWSRLWLSHVYYWWLLLRPDHDYDWVMFIIDDCPQAWSRLWLSHVYYW